jgi:hypothetical protein
MVEAAVAKKVVEMVDGTEDSIRYSGCRDDWLVAAHEPIPFLLSRCFPG